MSRTLLLAGMSIAPVVASAQDTASLGMTLSSANGGAGTLFSWSYTGSPTITNDGSYSSFFGIGFSSNARTDGSPSFGVTTGPDYNAFSIPLSTLTGLSTGLFLTNTTTNVSQQLTEIAFVQTGEFAIVILRTTGGPATAIPVAQGESLVLSGPLSGSYLSSIAYASFTAGQWTYDRPIFSNFETVLTVEGAPVPEPSTYGIVLGGLALAGAALRRRRKA